MSKNLSKAKFKKSLLSIGVKQSQSSFWYLSQKGKSYFKRDSFYMKLWLFKIDSAEYPVESFSKKNIAFEVLTVNTSEYVQGSIYNEIGKCINVPEIGVTGLDSIEVNFDTHDDLFSRGLYEIYSPCNYPIPDFKHRVLKGANYYKTQIKIENKTVTVILPLQSVIDFFFFNFSTKLNNYILENSLEEIFEITGIVIDKNDKYPCVTQNRQKVSKRVILFIAQFFFTTSKIQSEAIDLLRTSHLFEMKNGKSKFYLKTKIPFDIPSELKLLGQYIDKNKNTFLANRITGFRPLNQEVLFDFKKIIISVINDTSSVKGYENDEERLYDMVYNNYGGISDNVDYTDSDGKSTVKEIKENENPLYSFSEIPESSSVIKGSNKHRYVLDKIIKGKDYIGGTANLRGYEDESQVTKIDRITLASTLAWNIYAISAIDIFCSENKFGGSFIKLYKDNISLKEFRDGREDVFTSFNFKKLRKTKFILFEFSRENYVYYFFEKGSGSYSAVFRSTNNMILSKNQLFRFLKSITLKNKLDWSARSRDEAFMNKHKIKIFQPITHPSKSDKKEKRTDSDLIKILIKSIKKRIIVDIKNQTLGNK